METGQIPGIDLRNEWNQALCEIAEKYEASANDEINALIDILAHWITCYKFEEEEYEHRFSSLKALIVLALTAD